MAATDLKTSYSSSPSPGPMGASGLGQEDAAEDKETSSPLQSSDEHMASSKSKDPNKPKRKKARRACGNCQRAHLTCGDERPCQRCIKRNIADNCQDGARKKAKYLHDAPNEAILPGRNITYANSNTPSSAPQLSKPEADAESIGSAPLPPFLPLAHPTQYANFPPPAVQTPMFPPMQDAADFARAAPQPSPSSSQFSPYQQSTMQQMAPRRRSQSLAEPPVTGMAYTDPYLNNPNDLSLYDFDLASMNFGNHYGALEFGMLGHMSSGANDRPLQTPAAAMTAFDTRSLPATSFANNTSDLTDFSFDPRPAPLQLQHFGPSASAVGSETVFLNSQKAPHAYVIGNNAGSLSGTSPASSGSDNLNHYESSSIDPAFNNPQQRGSFDQNGLATTDGLAFDHQTPQHQASRHIQPHQNGFADGQSNRARPRKPQRSLRQGISDTKIRARDPSFIYASYTEPYPYTIAFHRLTAFLQRRFSSQQRLRIAKALASIRPSFISLSKSLIQADLVFMEKCFQRGLWDYEDFSSACGTPTIVCRRTGEVAHAGKEFTEMTGWTKEILTGRQPNLNVNKHKDDSSASGAATATSSRGGFNTPKNGEVLKNEATEPEEIRQQAVFLAELLDESSVIQFYEDYAKLAFADRKGSAWSPCKLLKYRAVEAAEATRIGQVDGTEPRVASEGTDVSADENVQNIGQKDGRIDCMFCWMVKRDVFNIPMMIVINFLPVF